MRIINQEGGVAWNKESFEILLNKVKANLNDTALQIALETEAILVRAHELKRLLKGKISFEVAYSYSEASTWLDSLVYKGFISQTSEEHLKEIPRYLQAGIERIQKILRDVNRDKLYATKLEALTNRLNGLKTRYPKDLVPKELLELKWMIEELRVSYFAQQLGVACQVSEKRILNEMEQILKDYPPLH